MLEQLFEFFLSLFGLNNVSYFSVQSAYQNVTFNIGGVNIPLSVYLIITLSIIAFIIIIVLCCKFIYLIIKTIGGLIR